MKVGVFDKILMDGIKQGIVPAKEQTARDWFRGEAKKLRKHQVNEADMFRDPSAVFRNQTAIGKMYLFHYDPKWKKELPYYDVLPLIFPFGRSKEGHILGLNMHYLPHNYRAKLMDALYETASNKRYNDATKLQISYDILNSASQFRFFEPAVHQYIPSHVRSRFMVIPPANWDTALFLPLERFEKATKAQVWKDSARKIRERNEASWKRAKSANK